MKLCEMILFSLGISHYIKCETISCQDLGNHFACFLNFVSFATSFWKESPAPQCILYIYFIL